MGVHRSRLRIGRAHMTMSYVASPTLKTFGMYANQTRSARAAAKSRTTDMCLLASISFLSKGLSCSSDAFIIPAD